MDINEYKLTKALEFGADAALNANTFSVESLKSPNDGRLAEAVIVCASSQRAIEDALPSVDRKGKILLFAVPESETRFLH